MIDEINKNILYKFENHKGVFEFIKSLFFVIYNI